MIAVRPHPAAAERPSGQARAQAGGDAGDGVGRLAQGQAGRHYDDDFSGGTGADVAGDSMAAGGGRVVHGAVPGKAAMLTRPSRRVLNVREDGDVQRGQTRMR